jgi:hypothetical protein
MASDFRRECFLIFIERRAIAGHAAHREHPASDMRQPILRHESADHRRVECHAVDCDGREGVIDLRSIAVTLEGVDVNPCL